MHSYQWKACWSQEDMRWSARRVSIIAVPSSAALLSCALVAAPFCERIERYNRLAFVLHVASYVKERRQGV